jgi:DNA polymerase III subunit epsilon
MLGADLVRSAQRRIESLTGLRTGQHELDESLWLKVDSFSLLQALAYLAQRLRDEIEVATVHLRLSPADAQRARLDLVWSGRPMSTETVINWELDPITAGTETSSLTVRDVVQRHGGEFWFEADRTRHQAFFRFLLPLAQAGRDEADAGFVRSDSRPEYYDFDLFARSESHHALDERRLVELAYTVFDTETTGLDPSGGDEIIQIGATRLVNGKLLRGESFEQLVDPRRHSPGVHPDSRHHARHGARASRSFDEVLPAFHPMRRTRCWWPTTRPSTCVSCN